MADKHMQISRLNDSSEPRFSRAVSLLREIVDILDVNNSETPSPSRQQGTRNRSSLSSFSQEPEPQPSTSRQLNNTPSQANTAGGTSRGDKVQNNGQSNILENFRSLFSPYGALGPRGSSPLVVGMTGDLPLACVPIHPSSSPLRAVGNLWHPGYSVGNVQ